MVTTQDWLDTQVDRVSDRQRARADTAKLVATFAAGVAGSLVASALQTGATASSWDWTSAWALAITIVLTVAVVLLDRLTEADHRTILTNAQAAGLDADATLAQLRLAAMTSTKANESVIKAIGVALWLQLISAVFTGSAAAHSMLSGAS